jgi:hypothetical protein
VARQVALVLIASLAVSMCGARISFVEGESMAPTIRAGDLVVTLPQHVGAPSVGSVLLVESEGRRLLHRLARYEEGSLWMKGDASVSGDSRPVKRSDVIGTLAMVIPTSHLYRAFRATAQFTAELPVSMRISSAAGVTAEQGPKYTFGADAQGRLLPGAYALWSTLLHACSDTIAACPGSYALRIDAAGFANLLPPIGSVGTPAQALARALRITTRCQSVGGSGTWNESSDLFTAEWSQENGSSGLLAVHDGAIAQGGVRCEVKALLLGSLPASGGSFTLPLSWGPA